MKKIKEEELAEFLLNPFQKVAYIGDDIIQKYERMEGVDDFILLDMHSHCFTEIGFVFYGKQIIVVEDFKTLNLEVARKHPFVDIDNLKLELKETVKARLEEVKESKIEQVKKLPEYINLKYTYKKRFLEQMIFCKLGAKSTLLSYESHTNMRINRFLNESSYDDLASIASGSMAPIDSFIDKLFLTDNFLQNEILIPDIEKEIDDYIAAGKFTKREQILIDYLTKTKASDAEDFTVELMGGSTYKCFNMVDCEGQVSPSDGTRTIIDIADIKIVRDGGKVIYQKTIW